MASAFIFPTSIYGTPADVYGTAVAQYANTGGFPSGSGLQLGMFGVLFDRTICRLLKTAAGVNPFDAVTMQSGNSNDYTVQQANAVQQYIVGANDRSGSTPLVAGNIAWFTEYGNATVNALASLTAGAVLVSSTTPGFMGAYTPGTASLQTGVITGNSIQDNVVLENATTTQGPAAVRFG